MQTKAKTFAELSATGTSISYELAPKLQKQQKQTNKQTKTPCLSPKNDGTGFIITPDALITHFHQRVV